MGWTRRSIGRSCLRGGWRSPFGARLHVLYTVEDPLSAGWTAEVSADRLPEVHEAMETEARQRLSSFIPGGSGASGRPDRARHWPGRRGDRPLRRSAGHRSGDRPGQSGDAACSEFAQALLAARAAPFSSCADGRDRVGAPRLRLRERMVSDGGREGEIRWFSPDPRGIIPLETSGCRSGWRGCGARAASRSS